MLIARFWAQKLRMDRSGVGNILITRKEMRNKFDVWLQANVARPGKGCLSQIMKVGLTSAELKWCMILKKAFHHRIHIIGQWV